MAHELQYSEASVADVAADMENHRKTYSSFLTLLKWSIIGATILLLVVFVLLLQVDVERVPGGEPPPLPTAPLTE